MGNASENQPLQVNKKQHTSLYQHSRQSRTFVVAQRLLEQRHNNSSIDDVIAEAQVLVVQHVSAILNQVEKGLFVEERTERLWATGRWEGALKRVSGGGKISIGGEETLIVRRK